MDFVINTLVLKVIFFYRSIITYVEITLEHQKQVTKQIIELHFIDLFNQKQKQILIYYLVQTEVLLVVPLIEDVILNENCNR